MEVITSINNEKIKNARKLLQTKNIIKEGKFLIEGDNLVEQSYKNNLLLEVFALESYENKFNLNVTYVSEKVMSSLSDLKSLPKVIGVSKINNKNEIGEKIVILDDVQDPGNIGTIIRSCAAFNVDTLVLSPNCAKPYTPKVLRSCVGMIFNLNIIISPLENIIKDIQKKGIEVYATVLDTNAKIEEINNEKFAIVFGNEGAGINKDIIKLCNKKVKIEMDNKCESLNVAVSASIILYNIYRRNI